MIDMEPEWVHLAEDKNGILMNSYFAEHPEMVVGQMEMVSGPYGMEPTCMADRSRPFEEQLKEAVSHIEGHIDTVELDELEDEMSIAETCGEYYCYATHEQYFYPDYFSYQPEYPAKILKAAEIMHRNGFEYFFIEELAV